MWNKINEQLPIGVLLAIFSLVLMLFPMPSWVLDIIFTLNIVSALMVLLTAIKTEKALDFSSFPTVLLLTTLLRLALNVASTRLILAQGHQGGDVAGFVIESFGEFLLAGNFAVGFAVFVILLIINFMVITKGAGRIAEVSARFALDALPGKQMAIDADLSAGIINEAEAKKRREEVGQEADFYGSMDGAAKFVRGDAIAAVLIFILGAIGGLLMGLLKYDMPLSQAASIYMALAIGDAIASQVPALLLSMAAGILVSKAGNPESISKVMVRQLFQHGPIMQASVMIGLLGLLPNMPHIPFLLFAVGLFFIARKLKESARKPDLPEVVKSEESDKPQNQELSWGELEQLNPLSMEIGYRLINVIDAKQGGDFLQKAKAIRKKFAQEWGFLPPALRIRDNLELKPNQFNVKINEQLQLKSMVYPELMMCLKEDDRPWRLAGQKDKDPTYGMEVLWIDSKLEMSARAFGYAVINTTSAMATALSHTMNIMPEMLFDEEQLDGLVDWMFNNNPKKREEIKTHPQYTLLIKVCKVLLAENIPLTNFKTIVQEFLLLVKKTDDPEIIAEMMRRPLATSLASKNLGSETNAQAFILNEQFEQIITTALKNNQGLSPDLTQRLLTNIKDIAAEQDKIVLIVSDGIRLSLSKILRRTEFEVVVLAFNEIPERMTVDIIGQIG